MKNIFIIIKEVIILYCIIFTVGTLVNSIGVLYLGMSSNPDVHGHIILRAGIVFMITTIITAIKIIMKNIILKSKTKRDILQKYTIACAVGLLMLLIYIWVSASGLISSSPEDIHPNAFRDMFRSIFVPAVIFAIIGFFIMKRQKPGGNDKV